MDAYDSFRAKVDSIFSDLVGERAVAVRADHLAKDVILRIKRIYAQQYDPDRASALGLHMSDWSADAAFVVALHLFPERFTDEEIEAGISMFLGHAPNHIRAACQITGQYVWVDFPDSDPDVWEQAP
jgi:hypothetical protein